MPFTLAHKIVSSPPRISIWNRRPEPWHVTLCHMDFKNEASSHKQGHLLSDHVDVNAWWRRWRSASRCFFPMYRISAQHYAIMCLWVSPPIIQIIPFVSLPPETQQNLFQTWHLSDTNAVNKPFMSTDLVEPSYFIFWTSLDWNWESIMVVPVGIINIAFDMCGLCQP